MPQNHVTLHVIPGKRDHIVSPLAVQLVQTNDLALILSDRYF